MGSRPKRAGKAPDLAQPRLGFSFLDYSFMEQCSRPHIDLRGEDVWCGWWAPFKKHAEEAQPSYFSSVITTGIRPD